MARVPYFDPADTASPEAHAAWARLQAERPKPTANVFRLVAHSPAVLDASLDYGAALRASTEVDPRLRELAILAVAHTAGVNYALVHHSGPAMMLGVRPEQIAALGEFETSSEFDETERALVRLAVESTKCVTIAEDTWAAVASRFTTRELVEFALVIAYYNNGARLMAMLDVELEDAYAKDPTAAFQAQIEEFRRLEAGA